MCPVGPEASEKEIALALPQKTMRGGSSRKLTKLEVKAIINQDAYLMPGFSVSKNDQTLECCYQFYESYHEALSENMGDNLKSLLGTVTLVIVEYLDKITDAKHEYLRCIFDYQTVHRARHRRSASKIRRE